MEIYFCSFHYFQNQDKWKNPTPMTMNNMQQGAVQLKNSQTNQQQFINQAIASSVGTLINPSVIGSHPAHLPTNMVHTQLAPMQNHTLGNNLTIQNSAMMLPPLQGMQNAPQLGQQGLYDIHQHPGTPMQAMNGIGKSAEHLMYLSQAGMLAPGTNQFLQQGQNQLGLTPVAAIRNQVTVLMLVIKYNIICLYVWSYITELITEIHKTSTHKVDR